MPEKKSNRLDPGTVVFIPPEGVAQITGSITYDGRWYEDGGQEEVGAYDDPVTGEHIPGKIVQKYGRLVQAVDDGNPTTPVWYEPYEGDVENYKPTKRADSYDSNVQRYIADTEDSPRGFEGHPTDPEDPSGVTTVDDLTDEEKNIRKEAIGG